MWRREGNISQPGQAIAVCTWSTVQGLGFRGLGFRGLGCRVLGIMLGFGLQVNG